MKKHSLFVTQPDLPPLEEFLPYLQQIWDSKLLTNGGPFHQQLEAQLCDYLGVEHISLFTNATIALITALQALEIKGEVITTPYSFVATAHSLIWNGIQPVFVDIDPATFNLDASRIEAAITPQTTGILPVHCYGRPCDVEAIQRVANEHKLKVLYDAAHAFGVRDRQGSVLRFGDLSVLSFHATKVFNTFEGGAIISPDRRTKQRIDYLKNFGIADEVTVVGPGINGKMSEINASFGLVQLAHVDDAIRARAKVDATYRECLQGVEGVAIPALPQDFTSNFGYFPVLIDEKFPISRDRLYERMRDRDVFARRYFYPLISDFPIYSGHPSADRAHLQNASRIANQILCLPIFPAMEEGDIDRVVSLICSV